VDAAEGEAGDEGQQLQYHQMKQLQRRNKEIPVAEKNGKLQYT
jgi:hypothetical protein